MNKEKAEAAKPGIIQELSGSMGDLGTLLPHLLAVITVAGLSSTSVFMGFGLFYLFSGWFYGIPMAVQPMKAATAAILVQDLTVGEIAAAGIVIGAVLLIIGLSGLINWIARLTPDSVTGGIQVGLGISLAILGIKMVAGEPWLGILTLLMMLVLLFRYQNIAALAVLFLGTAVSLLYYGDGLPSLSIGLHLPEVVIPALSDFKRGTLMVVLPQLPLTLTNAVLVTSLISRDLYPAKHEKLSEKNLCLTMGGANLLIAPLGGYMMCHGSGGVVAHHRYGARTPKAIYMIGIILLLFGLLLGDDALVVLRLIPEAVLGCLLFYSGIDLAMSTRNFAVKNDRFMLLIVAVLTIAVNPAVAFISGIVIDQADRRRWIKIS
ncbi:MAG TPA: putative sulfate/molybdate transporter [Syntrophomonadaceae bacterium]|jgi:SulP family sulfate permease|nr:putative sulfate/molybdate transporter [Syntrophomonadaceae bacterium]HRX22203.1 putative sulfate/molybdate transporter [Syntrophomonadaceae bacterium]